MRTRRIVTAAAAGFATVALSLGAAGTAQAAQAYPWTSPWTTSAQCAAGGGFAAPVPSFSRKVVYRCQGGLYSGSRIRSDFLGRPM